MKCRKIYQIMATILVVAMLISSLPVSAVTEISDDISATISGSE